jgi:hypothetical protein
VAALLVACVDYAGPPPGQETQSNQPSNPAPSDPQPSNPQPSSPQPSNPPPSNPAPSETPDPGAGAGDELVSFDRDVHPILVAKCGMCHEGVAPALPDHGAEDLEVAFAATQAMSNDEPVYMRNLARASGDDPSGLMPPSCAGPPGSAGGCLTQDEFETIELWVEQGATQR